MKTNIKYFLVLLFMTSLNCFAQSHETEISEFRKKYMDDFLSDSSSPLKKDDLQFLRFYDADSTYRVNAKVEVITNAPTFVMPVFSGTGQQYARYAKLKFTLKGKPMELTVQKYSAGGGTPIQGLPVSAFYR